MLKNKCGYGKRFYREWVKTEDLHLSHIAEGQTDAYILSDKIIDKKLLKKRIKAYQSQINEYISKHKDFAVTLKPLDAYSYAPPIVKEMATASRLAGVGPMAAVAGAIAQYLSKDILKQGVEELIIENGGDIFLKIKKIRYVSIYAGNSLLTNKIFLKIYPPDSPLGICTSSATVGHSLSFGKADAVTILAKDAIISDAVATATCNLIKSKEDINTAIEFVKNIKQVMGIVIIFKNKLASWGKVEFL